MTKQTKTIKTDYLARVEGEGGMRVEIENGRVTDVRLRIYEPPRFFEAFLRGRGFMEAPDITARICGICPVAYQMSAVRAMERICGIEVNGQIRALRRLLYCGEWIESHALHVYMLHLPDFLGYEGAIALARDKPDAVAQALALKKVGNEVMSVVGGREVHPINLRVGGWYRAPRKRELAPLVEKLERAREIALATVKLTASLDFPDYDRDYELVALSEPGEYGIDRGRIVSNRRHRHRRLRIRPALRGGARRVVERLALADHRARLLPLRAARALRARLRPPQRACARCGCRRRTHARRAQSVPEHHRARGRARVCG